MKKWLKRLTILTVTFISIQGLWLYMNIKNYEDVKKIYSEKGVTYVHMEAKEEKKQIKRVIRNKQLRKNKKTVIRFFEDDEYKNSVVVNDDNEYKYVEGA